ncbi:MAG: MBL fold metallo-hydrolase, partial [Myxococcaceae bacterium]
MSCSSSCALRRPQIASSSSGRAALGGSMVMAAYRVSTSTRRDAEKPPGVLAWSERVTPAWSRMRAFARTGRAARPSREFEQENWRSSHGAAGGPARTLGLAMTRHELGAGITVHVHASGEGGIFVNAFLVETRGGVVAVDSTLTETESRAFRQELESLRKPLLAALVTHPHPDHVAGLTNLVKGEDTRIVATRPVLELMRTLEEPKRKQWTPVYGAEWVQRWTYPNVVVESGERLTFDGVTYRVLDVGAGGDSDANAVWCIDSPQRTAFLGDLVFAGTHSYVADGHLLAWLANLERLEGLCRGMER